MMATTTTRVLLSSRIGFQRKRIPIARIIGTSVTTVLVRRVYHIRYALRFASTFEKRCFREFEDYSPGKMLIHRLFVSLVYKRKKEEMRKDVESR